eukprot:364931-Chlamydomonas_euryale.AAC.1
MCESRRQQPLLLEGRRCCPRYLGSQAVTRPARTRSTSPPTLAPASCAGAASSGCRAVTRPTCVAPAVRTRPPKSAPAELDLG